MRCLVLWLVVLPQVLRAGNILVYSPSISKSHVISNTRIAETLASAGHHVVILLPEYQAETKGFKTTDHPNVTTIRMENIGSHFDDNLADCESGFAEVEFTSNKLRMDFELALMKMCREIMLRREELESVRNMKFDVGFTEQVDTCGLGVLHYLGIKNILWISTTALMEANSYRLGVPQPASYVPTIEENDNSDVLSFTGRAYNLYMYLVAIYIHRYGADGTTEVFRSILGPEFPHVGDIAANSSLCFVNSDEQFDLPRPTIWKNIFIGGLAVGAPKPLEKDIAAMLAKGRKGVVLVSFGTIAPFHALPIEKQTDIIDVLRELTDYHFILKITNDDTTTAELAKGMKNLDLVTWIPQNDVLAHPRLKLFLMHGGLNGLMEAAHRGIPVVIIPFFADQFRNGRLVEKRGMGKVILKLDLNRKVLKEAVVDVLTHESYKRNAIKVAKLLRTRPFTAAERLVKWTEFAIENGVLDHLHVEGSRMNTIVYFNVDVIAAVVIVLLTLIYTIYSVVRRICCSGKGRNKLKKQ